MNRHPFDRKLPDDFSLPELMNKDIEVSQPWKPLPFDHYGFAERSSSRTSGEANFIGWLIMVFFYFVVTGMARCLT